VNHGSKVQRLGLDWSLTLCVFYLDCRSRIGRVGIQFGYFKSRASTLDLRAKTAYQFRVGVRAPRGGGE
jgi:hypothetical protein